MIADMDPELRKKVLDTDHRVPHYRRTKGQKAADFVTELFGSWTFITLVLGFILVWALINLYFLLVRWDPYPFIMLNLVLSCLAALQAPIILMSQNRAADRDRIKNERDFAVNRKSEREIEAVRRELRELRKVIEKI